MYYKLFNFYFTCFIFFCTIIQVSFFNYQNSLFIIPLIKSNLLQTLKKKFGILVGDFLLHLPVNEFCIM